MSYAALCKDCTERYLGCHSECDRYKEYREGINNRNNARFKDKESYSYVSSRITQYQRKGSGNNRHLYK